MSIPCNPSAGPHMPISVLDYPSAVLRLSDLLSLPPILIQDPALLCMPSITLLLATSPQHSPCAAVSFLAHRAALPPWSQQHTHTKPLLPIKHFILQNLTIKTNPYPANKLKTKAVP